MNAAVESVRRWNKRTTIVIAVTVLVLAAGGLAAWNYWRDSSEPPDARRAVWKYLTKQARTKDFKAPFEINNAALVATNAPATVILTNNSGKIRTVTRAPRTTGKAAVDVIPQTMFSAYFLTNHMQAESYQDMYKLIGQQLFAVERLLEKDDMQQQLIGLAMTCEAANYARTNAMNPWLASRICQAYLWPNIALVESTNRMLLTPDAILNVCDNAFQDAGDTNSIIRNYELMISKVSRSPAYVDLLRYRLAHVYQELGQEEKALPLLKQIKNYRMNRVPQEIAAMEKRLKDK